ncbi:carboxypeptidase M32 [Stygiolobus caldivivus]|uniref:Metal-dependent carboxypeptidase n=1 Tax=Stygiolobus caldivivus TaxID=2824673 RepID=A0A8D5U910_9CREN|nr:carboxypeptidase M32 [Stygiolobus caldivivus]BCU71457.1 carboxypeptidase M32 [Stygiolobus caldivivus]
MFENIKGILEEYKKLWAYSYSEALMTWDTETYMPEADASVRGDVFAVFNELEKEVYMRLAGKLEGIEEEKLTDEERGVIRVLRRNIKYYTKIPIEIIKEFTKITNESVVVWRNAKSKSDFKMFSSYLEKIVNLSRQIADYLGYEKEPYDALLDLYEEGFNTADGDKVFERLLPELGDILKKVEEDGYFPKTHELESVPYEAERMKKVNEHVVKMLGMPTDKFRLDISAHPFTIRISGKDVRITTRYEGKDFKATMFSVIHESGHAMYELMVDERLEGTPIASGASTGIHESQSRFWENVIGRSREFVDLIYPTLKDNLPFLSKYDKDEVYRYFNTVKPSLIRVDADEVTYNFHIAVRYEIEKRLINERLKVDEVPSLWNELMSKYLGVTPKDDAEGVLQDIHWSQGSIGYFPTYTLGNIVAGMLYAKITDLYSLVSEAKFDKLRETLRELICKYGATYPPKVLLRRAFGTDYDPEGLIKYLRDKYLAKGKEYA